MARDMIEMILEGRRRAALMLVMRRGGMTLKDIGSKFKVSKQRVFVAVRDAERAEERAARKAKRPAPRKNKAS